MDKYDLEIQSLMLNLFKAIKTADKDNAEVLFNIDSLSVHIIAEALAEKKLI